MTSRRSKYAASIGDRASSINDYSEGTSQENFITEFLTRCEEYDIESLPGFIVRDGMERYAKIESEKLTTLLLDIRLYVPVTSFHVARQEVSICILAALNTTLQKYNTLTVLKLPGCQINGYGILQIAQILMEFECLDDLNLDDNPNVQENYYLLCAPARNLRYLSLRMCKLSDNGIQKIANELGYRDPPNDPKLIALNVADNDITDTGAEYIAVMLRTNRSLQSMVLTGNKIQDDGASLIIQELSMSALTHEEIVDLRRRRFIELESKLDSRDTQETPVAVRWRKSETWQRNLLQNSKRTSQDNSSEMRIQPNFPSISDNAIQTSRRLPDNDTGHPFTRETVAINGYVMTSGNFNLQHLSLSFNRLTNKTLTKLVSCLDYQNYMLLRNYSRGLLHAFLEGNDIERDKDWTTLQELLRRRRQENQTIQDEDFKDFENSVMSMESEILRSKISSSASSVLRRGRIVTFVRSLHFAEMLLHIATVTLLVNIAIIELDTFYSLSPEKDPDVDFLLDESPLHRVFVYGTLKRGEPNHSLIKDTANGYAKFLGLGRTTVPYPLVIATKYNIPFLLKKPDTGHCVLGEIYDVDSVMLKRLDELEEHPQFYERTEEMILLASEAALKPGKTFEEVGELTRAWIYFLPRFKSSLLDGAMYTSYTNNGSHGLKYCENGEDASSLDDVL